MTRALVFGGRDYQQQALLFARLDLIHQQRQITTLIEGGAAGADRLARQWALSRGIPVATYEADWDNTGRVGAVIRFTRHGKPYNAAAGGIRNQRMIDEGRPDLAIAFPGGVGTQDMLRRLYNTQIEVITA